MSGVIEKCPITVHHRGRDCVEVDGVAPPQVQVRRTRVAHHLVRIRDPVMGARRDNPFSPITNTRRSESFLDEKRKAMGNSR